MSTARKDHGVAAVNGKLYAIGGYADAGTFIKSVECFDPSTGQWTAGVPMDDTRCDFAVVAMECPVDFGS